MHICPGPGVCSKPIGRPARDRSCAYIYTAHKGLAPSSALLHFPVWPAGAGVPVLPIEGSDPPAAASEL